MVGSTADGQAANGGAPGAEPATGRWRLRCCIKVTAVQVRKALWGIAMVMCVCSSWAGSTQLAKLTFKQVKNLTKLHAKHTHTQTQIDTIHH